MLFRSWDHSDRHYWSDGKKHTLNSWAIMSGTYCIATTDQNDANARLIAAAPDLLAACDEAVAALMLLPPDCLDDVAGQPSRDELINNIFSAIARARPE